MCLGFFCVCVVFFGGVGGMSPCYISFKSVDTSSKCMNVIYKCSPLDKLKCDNSYKAMNVGYQVTWVYHFGKLKCDTSAKAMTGGIERYTTA